MPAWACGSGSEEDPYEKNVGEERVVSRHEPHMTYANYYSEKGAPSGRNRIQEPWC
jgi:hypothetical protein